jgi:hypothetical protein
MEQQCNLSICSNYNPELSKEDNNKRVANGWSQNILPWNEETIKKITTSNAISLNKYYDGHRCNTSWTETTGLMLDFDEGKPSLDEMLEEQKRWKYNSYIFPSQNHQKEKKGLICDRFRVLIPFLEPVKDKETLKKIEYFFMDRYPTLDKTFAGTSRYFAHGRSDISSFVGDKDFFDVQKLQLDKITLPEIKKTKRINLNQDKTSVTLDMITDLADGTEMALLDIPPDEPIFCPFCGYSEERSNKSHNAVIKINPEGFPFLFCSSCQARGKGFNGVYNFEEADAFIYIAHQQDKMVFIDTIQSKTYGGCIENGNDIFIWRELKTKDYVKEFLNFHKLPKPKIYPRARYELHFDSNKRYDFPNGFVNKYAVTEYIEQEVPTSYYSAFPKTIGQLIFHVLGNDVEIMDHFMNYLAYFIQKRRKMITSFLFQGTEGSGKGFLFNQVLAPIIGKIYCTEMDMHAFKKEYNKWLTDNLLVLVNEVSANFASIDGSNLTIIEKMKQAITDIDVQIEDKNVSRYNGKNVCTFIFATNRHNGVRLSQDDRRFNVAPRQEMKLHDMPWFGTFDTFSAKIAKELPDFVNYLKTYAVDEKNAFRVIDNEAKRTLQLLSMTSTEEFIDAINNVDTQWFIDNYLPEKDFTDDVKYIIDRLPKMKVITQDELLELYNNIMKKDLTKVAFSSMILPHLGPTKTHRDSDGSTKRGYKLNFVTVCDDV